jgi:hypothetical protein
MRGSDEKQAAMYSYVTLEQRIAEDHPARQIRGLVDRALARMDAQFDALYSTTDARLFGACGVCTCRIRQRAGCHVGSPGYEKLIPPLMHEQALRLLAIPAWLEWGVGDEKGAHLLHTLAASNVLALWCCGTNRYYCRV